jgi:hypothetical protein
MGALEKGSQEYQKFRIEVGCEVEELVSSQFLSIL